MGRFVCKKKDATGAIGYCILFGLALILVITTMYIAMASKLMSEQHTIDDALSDSVLASLVADDVYYFETAESYGYPVVRFRNREESYNNYMACMRDAISNTEGFYYNFEYTTFIEYEVEDSQVRITTYSGNGGARSTSYGRVGSVKTPAGEVVRKTSAYAKVTFDLKSILDDSYIRKTRDIYCALKINY